MPEEELAHIIIIEQAEIDRQVFRYSIRKIIHLQSCTKNEKDKKEGETIITRVKQNAKVNQKRQICEGRSSSLGRRAERCGHSGFGRFQFHRDSGTIHHS